MKTRQKLIALACALSISIPNAMGGNLNLADLPLSIKSTVPPNVLFSLSVEFPTAVSKAYGGSYAPGNEYLGYFDPGKCYSYVANPASDPGTDKGWFEPTGPATSHACTDAWSGNFLNWASMTGLDEFRHAMTGGSRYVDTSTLTVLERAYNDAQSSTGYFPNKSYSGSGAYPFPPAETLTIVNATKGQKMNVAFGGTDTMTCTNPSKASGTFSCMPTIGGFNNKTGTCNTWTGDGSSGSPYKCTSVTFTGVGTFTIAANTLATSGAASAVSTSSTETINCTNPQPTNAAVTTANFSCTLKDLANDTRQCTTWGGLGSSLSPFNCTTWGAFNGETFAAASATSSSFSSTFTGSDPGSTSSKQCVVTLDAASGKINYACSNVYNGHNFSCLGSTWASSCNGTWTSNGNEQDINASATSNSPTTKISKNSYKNTYNFSWTTPTTGQSYYYNSSYTGADIVNGTTYFYYPTYTMTYGGTPIDYNVRVKVCVEDAANGIIRESNCVLQADGVTYKPTGVVQDKSEMMRFGVFSYFNSSNIDNAVMRSRLKHVGPKKYATGGSVTNAFKEWLDDGTLIKNPDSADAAASKNAKTGGVDNSGVINYINKFGTTGTGANRYKGYDPLGKLYYESLRYLRALTPTTAFSKDVTSTNDDNFPVITDWYNADRELERYSCQKNYIITMGDKNTHCDKRLPGGTLTNSSGQCNANANGTTQIADAGSLGGDSIDVTTETNYVGAKDGMGNIGGVTSGSGGAGSYYIAGMASWAARNNIRPDKTDADWLAAKPRVKSFILNVEEGGDCSYHSQFWLAAKYGEPKAYDDGGNPSVAGTWSNPATDTVLQDTKSIWSKPIDIMANSCTGGLPTGYATNVANNGMPWPAGLLRGGDPANMIQSVKSALDEVAAQIGTESALAQSSGDLRTSQIGAYVYRAIFGSQNWVGDVQAYLVSKDGTIADTAAWKASNKLPAWGSRKIFTFNDGLKVDGTADSGTFSRTGVDFSASSFSNLSPRQQDFLNRDEKGVLDTSPEKGSARVSYVRGDTSKDSSQTSGYGWRARATPLGDIVNSNPLYVGDPIAGIRGKDNAATDYYKAFAKDIITAGRTPILYVGANDGMLHGFDVSVETSGANIGTATANAGIERIAYVPSAVYKNLPLLTSATYSHKYFVDGSPSWSEACFDDCDSKTKWKSVLAGGLNAGGQGIYALDVTYPDKFFSTTDPALPANVVLWEFTDRDDKDLGNTYGKPEIRLMNNDKWAVISGNGYNNTIADGSVSTTGRASLFVLYVDGPGNGNAWVQDTHYVKIELKSPTESAATLPNGIAYIAPIDTNLDGKVDYIYAGDLNGNLWKIDVRDSDPTKWKSAFGTVADPLPLFTAMDGGSPAKAQAITGGIEVSLHPMGGYLVMFGTGMFIQTGDNSTSAQQSYYGIWDKNDGTRVSSRNSLQKQKVAASLTYNGTNYFFMTQCAPNYTTSIVASNAVAVSTSGFGCPDEIAFTNSGQQFGWLIDFPNSGERYINDKARLGGGILTFSTLQPNTNPCTGNTIGREYDLDYLTGGASANGVFDLNGDASLSSADYLTIDVGGILVKVPPSGTQYGGGASKNGSEFQLPPPAGGSSTTTACTDFVPGWGCPSLMGRSTTNCKKWVEQVISNENLTGGTGSGLKGTKKCLNAPSGRLNWRQIIR